VKKVTKFPPPKGRVPQKRGRESAQRAEGAVVMGQLLYIFLNLFHPKIFLISNNGTTLIKKCHET
jgi:hypothetical protein